MDIILKPFNNPNLPITTFPGFVDTFDRPQAETLGTTDDEKSWRTFSVEGNAPGVWGTTGNGTATMITSGSRHHMAVVDGLASDGTLKTRFSHIDGNRRAGLAIRVLDEENFIAIAPADPVNRGVRIFKRVNDKQSLVTSSGPDLAVGDELEVRFSGPSISVFLNGTALFSDNVPELQDVTAHGFYAFASAVAEWDEIKFTPA